MVALGESIERLLHNSEVFLDRQCHARGGEGSRVYVAISGQVRRCELLHVKWKQCLRRR
ncbi:unnamed protein product [Brassica oleracea]|uniref:Uncharacterized protein n=1 Tax=Brassica cretica TaxID=69181 RepID=A0A8S9MYR3_BRACR|nr:hypothetical protein F2Q69_00054305 [Brassica cretica]